MNVLPTYELRLDDTDSEVFAVSLVEFPAIERNWVAFSKQEEIKFALNEDQQILTGPALIPNMQIYRNQGGREFNVFLNEDTIREAQMRFAKRNRQSNTTFQHEHPLEGNTVFESYIIKSEDHAIAVGFPDLPVGTWMLSMHVESTEFWNEQVKTGKVKGFSIEAFFDMKPKQEKMSKFNQMINWLKAKFTIVNPDVEFDFGVLSDERIFDIQDGVMYFPDEAGDFTVVASPGEYTMADGTIVQVGEDGKIVVEDKAEVEMAEVNANAGTYTLKDGGIVTINAEGMLTNADGEMMADGEYELNYDQKVVVVSGVATLEAVQSYNPFWGQYTTLDGMAVTVTDQGVVTDADGAGVADGQYELTDGTILEVVAGLAHAKVAVDFSAKFAKAEKTFDSERQEMKTMLSQAEGKVNNLELELKAAKDRITELEATPSGKKAAVVKTAVIPSKPMNQVERMFAKN